MGEFSSHDFDGSAEFLGADSGAFEPSEESGLVLWLKGSAITGKAADDPVHVWNGSGGSPDATAGSSDMTYKTGGPNGKSYVRFTDPAVVNRSYASTPSIPAITGWTLFMVLRSFDSTAKYLVDAADGSHSIIQGYAAGKIEYFSSPRTVLADINSSDFQIVICTVGGTSAGVWTIGGDATHGEGNLSRPDIAEIGAYNSVKASDVLAALAGYLGTEYGL